MYGQKAHFSTVAIGISVASWWMWGVTVLLAAAAVVLMGRVFLTLHSKNQTRRP